MLVYIEKESFHTKKDIANFLCQVGFYREEVESILTRNHWPLPYRQACPTHLNIKSCIFYEIIIKLFI